MNIKKLTLSAMFVAIGVLTGTVIYIPVGIANCFPVQHAINVLCAVFLGPAYSCLTSFCIALIRNFIGTGTLLAFPASMVGAFAAAMAYKYTKNKYIAACGEIFGTGILGGLIAIPISVLLMGKEAGALLYVIPFLISSTGGSIIALLILKSTEILRLSKKIH